LTRLLQILGITLVLGGLAHSAGVIHLYTTQVVPDANRIMLDVWIAEAQLLSGGLYLAASRARRARVGWRGLAAFGALTMIGFAAPILPVLVARAPFIFRVPAVVYLVLSLIILSATGSGRRS
jgi:hypothetical protein